MHRSVPFNKKGRALSERTRPQNRNERNDNTTNPTRATAFHVIAPDDAASHQENAPRAPAETLRADFNRRGDYRLRDDRRLKWLNFM